jgi:RNA polymerase sigma-70 factor (ECF subfamily)
LVDAQTADDLTQDTLLHALQALPGFRAESSARTWLLTIARRACARHFETRDRMTATANRTSMPAAAGTAHTGRTELLLLINALSTERRAAFTLTQILGCSYQEAAQICHCPVGTIRSRVARAREDLISALATRTTGQEPRTG